jgi:predicted chitinase
MPWAKPRKAPLQIPNSMINGILKHKKTIGATGLLFLFIVLVDVFIRAQRVEYIISSCVASFGALSDVQKDSIRLIVKAFDRYGDKDKAKLAYILATARHESNFRPIEEHRTNTDRQNAYWYTGYYGRGFVQLTHENNYRKMSDFLGVDLVKNPSLALKPNNAAKILVYGMMNGQFTRKPLSNYINETKIDFYNARKTVNGTDRAERIADFAKTIQSNLI